jgi:hypothetical protein
LVQSGVKYGRQVAILKIQQVPLLLSKQPDIIQILYSHLYGQYALTFFSFSRFDLFSGLQAAILKIGLLPFWSHHDVSSPERKIQFLPLSAGQIGVRLIHILCLFSYQLFTWPSWLNLKKRILQIVRSLKSRELNCIASICILVKMFLKF